MRKERWEVQSRGEAGEKTGWSSRLWAGQHVSQLPWKAPASLGFPDLLAWKALGRPELTLLCCYSLQGTRICNVCSAAGESLPFEERNGCFGARPFCQRTGGRCSLIFTDSVPLLHSEVQAWPGQRGHFRGEFVYFKPRPASWVRFLRDDFVFCI